MFPYQSQNIGPSDIQVFTPSSLTSEVFQYTIPRGKSSLYIYALNGGGGGGGGFTGVAGTARGGGGGGGSSCSFTGIFPTYGLPDRLYLFVGHGGLGGTAGVAGSSGGLTKISILPNVILMNLVAHAGNIAGGGGAGTAAAGGAAGGAGAALGPGNYPVGNTGLTQTTGGNAGTVGGAQTGANGGVNTLSAITNNTSGGTGGGGTTSADFSGGAILPGFAGRLLDSRPATPAAGSFSGSSGAMLGNYFWNYAGVGGSSSNTGVGGAGGYGSYGCGGGGGGGGTTGGRGGDGGPGLVIMIAW